MAKSKRKRVPKTVLKLPDLEQSKSAVLNHSFFTHSGTPASLVGQSILTHSRYTFLLATPT